jgi:hypothetical protein
VKGLDYPKHILQAHHFCLLRCRTFTKTIPKHIYEIAERTPRQKFEGNVTVSGPKKPANNSWHDQQQSIKPHIADIKLR